MSLARVANVPPRGIGQRTLDELTRLGRDRGTSMYAAIGETAQDGDGAASSMAALPTRSVRALTNFRDLIEGLSKESESLDLVQLIDLVLERSGYKRYVQEEAERGEERWENLQEFRNTAKDFPDLEGRDALTAFLESVSLVSDTDNLDEKADAITLITLHQAKGLEYRAVFIVGMEEGLLPHGRSIDDPTRWRRSVAFYTSASLVPKRSCTCIGPLDDVFGAAQGPVYRPDSWPTYPGNSSHRPAPPTGRLTMAGRCSRSLQLARRRQPGPATVRRTTAPRCRPQRRARTQRQR